MSEDYLAKERRRLRNHGEEDSVRNIAHHFGRNDKSRRADILTNLHPDDGSPLELHDLDETLERRRIVNELHKVHHTLLRQNR
jgi:hypothetical protein